MHALNNVTVMVAGKHTDSSGSQMLYDEELLQQIAEGYDVDKHCAPIVLGHSSDPTIGEEADKLPAFGWVTELMCKGGELIANLAVSDALMRWIEERHFDQRSVSLYGSANPANPLKGLGMYLRHLAVLGAVPPAIKGMAPLHTFLSEYQIMKNTSSPKLAEVFSFSEATLVVEEPVAPIPAEQPETEAPATDYSKLTYAEADDKATAIMSLLRELIAHGESGYKSEITEFMPMPSPDNNYLFDADSGQFRGMFCDKTYDMTSKYRFVVYKDDSGNWTSDYEYYEEEGKTETRSTTLTAALDSYVAAFAEPASAEQEALPPEVEEAIQQESEPEVAPTEQEAEEDTVPLEVENTQAVPQESEPETQVVPQEQDSLDSAELSETIPQESETEPAQSEADMLIAKLTAQVEEQQAVIKAAELAGFVAFAETIYAEGKLTEGQLPKEELIALTASFAEQSVNFGEADEKSPSMLFRKLLTNLPQQLAYGECLSASAPTSASTKSFVPNNVPRDANMSEAGMLQWQAICEYCEKHELDIAKAENITKAQKALASELTS